MDYRRYDLLEESELYIEEIDSVVADVSMRKTYESAIKTFHSVNKGNHYLGEKTVDFFKIDRADGCEIFVLVQERSKGAIGKLKLDREYILDCTKANKLYKRLLKQGYYKR